MWNFLCSIHCVYICVCVCVCVWWSKEKETSRRKYLNTFLNIDKIELNPLFKVSKLQSGSLHSGSSMPLIILLRFYKASYNGFLSHINAQLALLVMYMHSIYPGLFSLLSPTNECIRDHCGVKSLALRATLLQYLFIFSSWSYKSYQFSTWPLENHVDVHIDHSI